MCSMTVMAPKSCGCHEVGQTSGRSSTLCARISVGLRVAQSTSAEAAREVCRLRLSPKTHADAGLLLPLKVAELSRQ